MAAEAAVASEQAPEADNIIVARDVHKWFGDFHALRGVTTSVRRSEVVVVIGPSGSGKSTFIRAINRLEQHQRGDIIVDGVEMTDDVRNIDAIRREVGMVFQSFNLFPHLTVLHNITLAPTKVRAKRPWPMRRTVRGSSWSVWAYRNRLTNIQANSRAVSSSVSLSPVRWRCSPRSCSSMSPRRLWTRR